MSVKKILDSILGTPQLPIASLDRLFSISTATITMESECNLRSSAVAGVCFKPIESSQYESARKEIEELLTYSIQETASTYRIVTDSFRFTWVILEDPDFEDLITGIHLVSQTFIEKGFGAYLLCAIFRFDGKNTVYWIYNFKQGLFYPFIPTGDKNRDNAEEFRLQSRMERELPIEKDVGMWYPLWGIPL